MKELDWREFLALFDPAVHVPIRDTAIKNGATAVVCFENRDFCSSDLGSRTAMVVGPTCTHKTVKECEGAHLNDLPSRRQYASYWCRFRADVEGAE